MATFELGRRHKLGIALLDAGGANSSLRAIEALLMLTP
jgi:hypothetical protein